MNTLFQFKYSGHSIIMGRYKNDWQNIEYILKLFGNTLREAKKNYRSYVAKGISGGKRPELTGGGLVRSAGGWTSLKALRKTGIRIKGDERILGENDYVQSILKKSEEQYNRKFKLKSEGFDFKKVAEHVAKVLNISIDDVLRQGRYKKTVKARSLLCYWANRELGITTIELSRKLHISQPAVSISIQRGEKIAVAEQYALTSDRG